MKGSRLRALAVVAVLTIVGVVPASIPAAGTQVPDQVLAWNQNAYSELIGVLAPPLNAPPVAAIHLAMVHGAIYDAVNAIDGGYQPYLGSPEEADSSDSADAAAAAAGYQMLRSILPDARDAQLEVYYIASLTALANAGVGQQAIDGGVAVGEAAATAMIAERTGDGRYGSPLFTEGTAPGDWRRAPLVTGGNNFKWVGDVVPFLIPSAEEFGTDGPLDLTSAAYAAEFNQVKEIGRLTSTSRTLEQTQMALFWSDHTLAMWTRIFRQLSQSQQLTSVENARLFAMLYLTGSDAAIACFQDKERWGFWRPETAIQLANEDENPGTVADTAWRPLLANPPYPDHPSGANCVSSAFVETLKDFFGTNQMTFSATHATLGITRTFTRFSQAITEVRLARVYSGIHFMTADAHGATIGRNVARYRDQHFFQPVS